MHALFTGLRWVDIVSYGWVDRSIQDIVKKIVKHWGGGLFLGEGVGVTITVCYTVQHSIK